MSRLRTLEDVCRNICIELGDDNARHMGRVNALVLSAIDVLNLSLLSEIQAQVFDISENLTVQLPDNVLDVRKVGTIDSDGYLVVMGVNPKIRRQGAKLLSEAEACTCGGQTTTTAIPSGVAVEDYCPICTIQNFRWNGRVGEFYGIRPDAFPNGVYRYDRDSNTIELGTGYDIAAGGQIWVEYKGTPDYVTIPMEMYAPLAAYTQYLWFRAADPNKSSFFMQEFRRHHGVVKRFLKQESLEDLNAAFLESNTPVVKR